MNPTPLAQLLLACLGILAMSIGLPSALHLAVEWPGQAIPMVVALGCGWLIWDRVAEAAPQAPGPWFIAAWAAGWIAKEGLLSPWASALQPSPTLVSASKVMAYLLLNAAFISFPRPWSFPASAAVFGAAILAIGNFFFGSQSAALFIVVTPLALVLLLLAIRQTDEDLVPTRTLGAILFGTGLMTWMNRLVTVISPWMWWAQAGLLLGTVATFAVWSPWGITLRRRDLVVYPLVAALSLGAMFLIGSLAATPDYRDGLNPDWSKQLAERFLTIAFVVSIAMPPTRWLVDRGVAKVFPSP